MTSNELLYIVSRIIDNSNDTIEDLNANPDDSFLKGKKLAYYEVLDTIKNELTARDQDLKELGLNIDLEKKFYSSKRAS